MSDDQAAQMLVVAIRGIEQLRALVITDVTTESLAAIDAGLTAIADGLAGKTDPAVVEAHLKSLLGIAPNDVDAKFDSGGATKP